MLKTFARAALAAALSLNFAAGAAAQDLNDIKERGTLRVAVAPLSPFVIKEKNGELSGYEIDAMSAFAADHELDVAFVERPFCELAEAVLSGEADLIASGFSNMDRRRRLLDFSLPYRDTEYFLVIDRATAKKAKRLSAFNDRAISIGYQIGGVSGMVAQGEFPGANLRGFSSFTEIVAALEAGEIDGAVMFEPYLAAAKALDKRKLTVPHRFALTRTIEAYATAKERPLLHDELNAWVIERDLAGYWDDLEEVWFADGIDVSSAPPAHACAAANPAG